MGLKFNKLLLLSLGVLGLYTDNANAQLLTGFDDNTDFSAASDSTQEPLELSRTSAPTYETANKTYDALNSDERFSGLKEQDKSVGFARDSEQVVGKNAFGLLTGFGGNVGSNAQSENSDNGDETNQPVDLQADELIHDEDSQIVTAQGDVMLVQAGRILRADKISYLLAEDRVIAEGYVVLNEVNGDIHTADRVELMDEMKSGFVEGLKTYLIDGSRFTARDGERKNGTTTIMREATYTPCEPCKKNPDKSLVWMIKASEVTHDEEEHRISYEHARFELYDIPVAYTPYFSHPDGTVKQKSGFLTPSFGLDSELGFSIANEYYWTIAPDKDATIGLRAFTEQLPLLTAEWRQRWDNASLRLDGGITYSGRDDVIGGQTVSVDDEVRGHVFAEGLWDLNDKWRTGLNVEYSSDDQYLRQYDFSSKDVLNNELFLERFSGRNYTGARLLAFQDVRVGDLQYDDQPQVLPEIISRWVGEPGAVPIIGGRWDVEGNVLGLRRDGSAQDVMRLSLETGWYRRFVSDLGLVASIDADVRGDFYQINETDFTTTTVNSGDDITDKRIFPQMHIQGSYPLARNFDNSQMIIEPLAALTAAPNMDTDDNIPNEDSQDIQIDTSNLFEANRFPGLDRVEDKMRVTYGLRTGLYGHDGSYGSIFLGQSRRLDDDDNPFPRGSGLDEQASDFVGEINADYKGDYLVNYRFQLADDNLESERHEFDGHADFGSLELDLRYLYANALEGTELDESREQIAGDIGYFWNDNWKASIGAVQDLGQNSGLRHGYIGLDHYGQCLSWSVRAVRNLTDDATGDSSTELVFRIGLKNLGEFQASGIEVASSSSSSSTSTTTSDGAP